MLGTRGRDSIFCFLSLLCFLSGDLMLVFMFMCLHVCVPDRCGRGGRSAPVDDLDRCCLEHATCYGRTVRQCPDVWKKPYNQMYAWTVLKDEVMCGK